MSAQPLAPALTSWVVVPFRRNLDRLVSALLLAGEPFEVADYPLALSETAYNGEELVAWCVWVTPTGAAVVTSVLGPYLAEILAA